MNRISQLAAHKTVSAVLSTFPSQIEEVLDLTIAIQQIPAPTFAEAKRADFIQTQFTAAGLTDVMQDELGNVYGRHPSAALTHPPVIISAHSDTVFPAGTDLTVQRDDKYIHGPGISDNSAGVAGIIHLAKTLRNFNFELPANVWFVSNVGEEGLGDLRGMRAAVQRFGSQAIYLVVEGGLYGQISHQAIGVRRFKITVETPGGHSWGSFGSRSAIHEIGRIIVAIDQLPTPKTPKTTYNVGVIEGGTSINTIAQSASLLLDCRSERMVELERLVTAVTQIVKQANKRKDVTVTMEMIGNRPAGAISREAELVQMVEAALKAVGCRTPHFIASSTDANIPLSEGMSAVCIGLAESNNAHRLDEYLNPKNLANGLGQLLLLTLATAGYGA
ncbi:MAG: M20/M25/M40 family metallo-hydrolase [Chloroflexi bacterium]|nr:M20/M25/M40 family metallo-hydrolase [Chloroflexota bacterium]